MQFVKSSDISQHSKSQLGEGMHALLCLRGQPNEYSAWRYGSGDLNPERKRDRVVEVVRACTPAEQAVADAIVDRQYSWRGYTTRPSNPTSVTRSPRQYTLVAMRDDHAIGTITIRLDGPNGLNVDTTYPTEVKTLRRDRRVIAELTRFAVDCPSESRDVIAALFEHIFVLSHTDVKVSDFLIEVNPRHVAYYKRVIGFEVMGEPRICARVGAPAVLMHLRMTTIEERLMRSLGLGGRKIQQESAPEKVAAFSVLAPTLI